MQQTTKPVSLITKLGVVLALALLLVLYFWGHNVGEQTRILFVGIAQMGNALLNVALVMALLAVAGGIGRWLLWRVGADGLSLPERIALEAALGLGLISIVMVLLGMGLLFSAALWGVLGVAFLAFIGVALGWLNDGRRVVRRALQAETGWQRFIVVVVLLMLGVALLLALTPPTNWDALTYHLEIPHRYIQDNRILTHADNHFFGFPQGMEILYGLLMTLGSDSAPAVLHWSTGVLAIMATAGLVRRFADATAAYMAGLLVMTGYGVWLLFGWPYVDLGVMLYGAAALVAAVQWRTSERPAWLMVMGVFAGYALGVKYTAGGMILALGVLIVWRSGWQPQRMVRNGLLFGLPLLLVFAPWLLKGALLYDNPLYPYFFGGVNWDSLRSFNFNAGGASILTEPIAWHWPILPIAASIFGVQDVSPYAFDIGVWLLTLPFLLIVAWGRLPQSARPLAQDALVLVVPLWAFWMFLSATSGIGSQPRLMLVGLPVVIVLGALAYYGLSHWPKRPLDVRFLLHAMMVLSLIFTGLNVVNRVAQTRVLAWFSGQLSTPQYIAQNAGIYYDAVRHLDTLPPGSTVRFLWEGKRYYCPDDITCIPDVLYDHWARPLMQGATIDDLMQQWRDENDYLLLHDGLDARVITGYDFWLIEHDYALEYNLRFPDALLRYWQPVWTDDIAYTLYAPR